MTVHRSSFFFFSNHANDFFLDSISVPYVLEDDPLIWENIGEYLYTYQIHKLIGLDHAIRLRINYITFFEEETFAVRFETLLDITGENLYISTQGGNPFFIRDSLISQYKRDIDFFIKFSMEYLKIFDWFFNFEHFSIKNVQNKDSFVLFSPLEDPYFDWKWQQDLKDFREMGDRIALRQKLYGNVNHKIHIQWTPEKIKAARFLLNGFYVTTGGLVVMGLVGPWLPPMEVLVFGSLGVFGPEGGAASWDDFSGGGFNSHQKIYGGGLEGSQKKGGVVPFSGQSFKMKKITFDEFTNILGPVSAVAAAKTAMGFSEGFSLTNFAANGSQQIKVVQSELQPSLVTAEKSSIAVEITSVEPVTSPAVAEITLVEPVTSPVTAEMLTTTTEITPVVPGKAAPLTKLELSFLEKYEVIPITCDKKIIKGFNNTYKLLIAFKKSPDFIINYLSNFLEKDAGLSFVEAHQFCFYAKGKDIPLDILRAIGVELIERHYRNDNTFPRALLLELNTKAFDK